MGFAVRLIGARDVGAPAATWGVDRACRGVRGRRAGPCMRRLGPPARVRLLVIAAVACCLALHARPGGIAVACHHHWRGTACRWPPPRARQCRWAWWPSTAAAQAIAVPAASCPDNAGRVGPRGEHLGS
ncbi:hypothetical protein QJS66_10465 [Kocuria rhizophila]|nr:hypothetical protein QJS66_10465 [Kocuria rhizophila]